MSEKEERNRLVAFWKARRRKKYCCRNCHFLAREDVFENGQRFTNTWTKEEREKGQIRRPEELASAPKCWQGIWDTGVNPELNSKLEEILDKNRKNDCFFIEHSDGMLFKAATELHRMRYENRNLKKSLVIATVGLYISGIAAIFNFFSFTNVEKFVKTISDCISLLFSKFFT